MLKQGHNVKLFLVEMKAATGKDIAEHIIRPARVILTSLVTVSYAPQPISIFRLQRYPMTMKEWWMRRQVGMRLTVVLMKVLIEWIELIVFHILIGSKWLSVKYLTSRWISGVPEYEPIIPTYLGATERDHWGQKEDWPRCKRGSGASGWLGRPQSR